MTEPAKETVIIVHGTWAAPTPGATQWYQPVDGNPADQGFVNKLDVALRECGSSARCWAHCADGNPIFEWSGKNDWIERTRAASALAAYVAKLRNEGWQCHIVAHSHGGNVVVEALPQILVTQMSSGSPSKIVTLGTPFIDTRAPIQKKEKWATALSERLGRWSLDRACILLAGCGLACILLVVGLFVPALRSLKGDMATNIIAAIAITVFSVLFPILSLILIKSRETQRSHEEGAARSQPQFLAIGSAMDEAWQILYHMRNIDDPLAEKRSLGSYLFSSVRSRISRGADIEHIIRGTQPFRSLSIAKRWSVAFGNVAALFFLIYLPFYIDLGWALGVGVCLLQLVAIGLSDSLIHRNVHGESDDSASQPPFRWLFRLTGALLSLPNEVLTYLVRRKAWPIMVATAMGLEGYYFDLPTVEQQHPTSVPKNFVKYEDMPKGAERNALDKRSAWVERHLKKEISQTFSKLVVTGADIMGLLRTIEKDQTLVHAAYYTDDECIARIANWIAATEYAPSQASADNNDMMTSAGPLCPELAVISASGPKRRSQNARYHAAVGG
jgi:hypothetical protein